MPRVLLASGEIYHIFNRGIEKRPIFTDKKEYDRAKLALDFYRHADLPLGLSQALDLENEKRIYFLSQVEKLENLVDILVYSLIPNHFHFLVKQLKEDGIKFFMSNFCNSYTRYFNLKHQRIGPLLQGIFKAVRIEDEEQLIHVSRYIHINPLISFVIREENLPTYPYTSFPEYLGQRGFCNKELVLNCFSSVEMYKEFVFDQVGYARKLEMIKHLVLE